MTVTLGKIFVITGPSGVGKGTLCKLLLAENSPALCLSISATSRPQRLGEEDGVHYHFKTPDAFQALIAHDQTATDPQSHHLLEWAQYNGNYYGTPRASVQAQLEAGRHVLLEIDTQGALLVKQKFPDACLIFIAPPNMDELERRLRVRATDAEADIVNRLAISKQEMQLQDQFDYILINESLDECFQELQALVQFVTGQGVASQP